ncbi:hypothetical protein FKM82_018530 [Ascaphus truei]
MGILHDSTNRNTGTEQIGPASDGPSRFSLAKSPTVSSSLGACSNVCVVLVSLLLTALGLFVCTENRDVSRLFSRYATRFPEPSLLRYFDQIFRELSSI